MARLSPRLVAEFMGTALLLCTVIGSGIMGERLAAGNVAIALLANTLATVFILFVLIESLGPLSGAHFNPLVTIAFGHGAGLSGRTQCSYIAAQGLGSIAGAVLANAMFGLPAMHLANTSRSGPGQWLGEVVATAGLILVIGRSVPARAGRTVATYVGAAYWFTSSTSFANPVAALGRMFSDTFAGISPSSVPAFIAAEIAGAALGVFLLRLLGRAQT